MTARAGRGAGHVCARLAVAGLGKVTFRPASAPRPARCQPPPPPHFRTKWTRRVPHPVLIGHAASLTPAGSRVQWQVRAPGIVESGTQAPPPPLLLPLPVALPYSPSLPPTSSLARRRAPSRGGPPAPARRPRRLTRRRAQLLGLPGHNGTGGCLCRPNATSANAQVRPVRARPPARGTRRVRLVRGEGRGVST